MFQPRFLPHSISKYMSSISLKLYRIFIPPLSEAKRLDTSSICLVGIGSKNSGAKFAEMLELPKELKVFTDARRHSRSRCWILHVGFCMLGLRLFEKALQNREVQHNWTLIWHDLTVRMQKNTHVHKISSNHNSFFAFFGYTGNAAVEAATPPCALAAAHCHNTRSSSILIFEARAEMLVGWCGLKLKEGHNANLNYINPDEPLNPTL